MSINRKEQVEYLSIPQDEELRRSSEEAHKVFQQALHRTKGKCNNPRAWFLANHKDATVEDVIKFGVAGSRFESGRAYNNPTNHKLSRVERIEVQQNKRIVKVRETVAKRFLESRGLWDEEVDKKYGGINAAVFRDITSSPCRELVRLLTYAKYAKVDGRFSKKCQNVMKHWVERIHLEVKPGVQIQQARKDMFDAEIEWLDHAPEEVLDRIAGKEYNRTQNFTEAVFNSGLCPNYTDSQKGFEFIETSKMFVEVLNHMGIGVADAREESHAMSLAQARIRLRELMKKTITLSKTFMKLVKQGFEPELARAEIVDQLNQYVEITPQFKIHWQFFSLDNAPTHYDYQKPAKAKKATTNGSGQRRGKVAKSADENGYIEVPGIGKLKVC